MVLTYLSPPYVKTEHTTADDPTRTLADSGVRSTPQREVIFQTLLEERDHPTAEELFNRVKTRLPSISLATVYNCLETLEQCGLVKPVNFERESTRFCPNRREHAHLLDAATGKVRDLELPVDLMDQLKAAIPPGFKLDQIEIHFRVTSAATR
jgi:Fur family transcriptional regulator, peroxide stress response regulator